MAGEQDARVLAGFKLDTQSVANTVQADGLWARMQTPAAVSVDDGEEVVNG